MSSLLKIAVAALALAAAPSLAQDEMLDAPESVIAMGSSLISNYGSTLQAASSSVADIVNTALSTAATATAGAGGAVRRGAATADALYSAYRAEYCAPALYIPSTRMPANFTSPGFSLTFSLGNCSLTVNPAPGVNCVGPYARYRQHPAVVTAPFIAPGRFVGESCVAAADFGTVRRNILHVFDKGATADVDQLAAQVSGAVVGISGAPLVAAPAVELPSYGVPMPLPVTAGSSASSAAAVGASGGAGPGAGLGAGLGAGGLGGGLSGGAAPDAAAAGASGSSGGRK